MKTRALAAALVAAASIALTACSTPPADAPVDLTGQDAFTGSDSATSSKSADDQAADAAVAAVREFYAVMGEVDSDSLIPVETLARVAGGPVLDKYTADILLRRSKAVTSTGAITVVDAQVTDRGVPQDDAAKPSPGPAWVHVVACNDISTWDSRFPDGTSALAEDRGRFVLASLTVRNGEWPGGAWVVTSEATEKAARC